MTRSYLNFWNHSTLPVLWNLDRTRARLEAGDLVRSHSSNPGENYLSDGHGQNLVADWLLDGARGRGMPQSVIPHSVTWMEDSTVPED